jgi:hypothetical protein
MSLAVLPALIYLVSNSHLDRSIPVLKLYFMPFIPGTNIKIVGGEFNDIKGNYRLIDHSCRETNINSSNMYHNQVTDAYNNNSKKFSEQFYHIYIQGLSDDSLKVARTPHLVLRMIMGKTKRCLHRKECSWLE